MNGELFLAVWKLAEEEQRVAPGMLGFLTTFFMAVALILLMLNMTKHLRIVQRSDVDEVRRRHGLETDDDTRDDTVTEPGKGASDA